MQTVEPLLLLKAVDEQGPAAPPPAVAVSDRFINRELSWLGFARRVLALVEDADLPLLERVKFAGIMGMLHDEFFMKRISGLKRQIDTRPTEAVPRRAGRRPRSSRPAGPRCSDQVEVGWPKPCRGTCGAAWRGGRIPILDHADLHGRAGEALRDVLPSFGPARS